VVLDKSLGPSTGLQASAVRAVHLPHGSVGLTVVLGAGDTVGRRNGAALPVTQAEECAVERCRHA
jgi:hypothetical protein